MLNVVTVARSAIRRLLHREPRRPARTPLVVRYYGPAEKGTRTTTGSNPLVPKTVVRVIGTKFFKELK